MNRMARDPKDEAIHRHRQWLGYLQPVGVVVSAPALAEGGIYVSDDVLADHQRPAVGLAGLRHDVGEGRCRDAGSGEHHEVGVGGEPGVHAGEAGATRVRCVLRDDGGRLRGAVEDDGPGVDPRVAGRIFGQGFSTKPDTTGFGRGYGLDLVRRTVTSRGGTIEVGPSALGGARFAFEMERV